MKQVHATDNACNVKQSTTIKFTDTQILIISTIQIIFSSSELFLGKFLIFSNSSITPNCYKNKKVESQNYCKVLFYIGENFQGVHFSAEKVKKKNIFTIKNYPPVFQKRKA